MVQQPYFLLSEKAKIDLPLRQAALIERLTERVALLEARLDRPKKTSRNSHRPPSDEEPSSGAGAGPDVSARRKKPRPSRPGFAFNR